MAKTVFDKIKKQNGESFAKTIRAYDNGIFEIPDIVNMLEHAGRGRESAEKLLNYLISLKDIQIEDKQDVIDFHELLRSVSYKAIVVSSLKEQNGIKKYFAPGEELCTFDDNNRYQNYYMIHLVKDGAENLKREDFLNPQREDEYGTSVMSIQILKNGGFISIKNRYNHTVANCDNTHNSNPDNIVQGLSASLKKYFDVDFSSQNTPVPEGWTLVNGKLIKYNHEINNVYFGEDCYVENGKVHKIDKNKEIMLDYFVLNLENKEVKNPGNVNDSFAEVLGEFIKDKKISIEKREDKSKVIVVDGEEILKVKDGEIIGINLPVESIGDKFLYRNKALTEINIQNVKSIGDNFLYRNKALTEINIQNVKSIGDNFLYSNRALTEMNLKNAESIGNNFLYHNKALMKINLKNVEIIRDNFLYNNKALTEINLKNVKSIGHGFLLHNEELTELDLQNVKSIGNDFLCSNEVLTKINLQNLESIGDSFLYYNNALTALNLQNVKSIGASFLYNNEVLTEINLSNVESIESYFLYNGLALTELNLKNVKSIGSDFLRWNNALTVINLQNVEIIRDNFLYNNRVLTEINMQNVKSIGNNCLACHGYFKDPNNLNKMINQFKRDRLQTKGSSIPFIIPQN